MMAGVPASSGPEARPRWTAIERGLPPFFTPCEEHVMRRTFCFGLLAVVGLVTRAAQAGDLPQADSVQPTKLFEVPNYCEGVVFDREGNGYVSHKDRITKFTLDGKTSLFAIAGAPNGHKILADGTHLVCDGKQHAVLHLDATGRPLSPAAAECDGHPLRAPNDLSLDTARGGFYFTDPAESDEKTSNGSIHYTDAQGKTHLVATGFAYPNGIVYIDSQHRLLVGESKHNRILEFPVREPGKVGKYKVFAQLPEKQGSQIDNQPDGMCLDAQGNLYVAHYGMKQVQVLSPEGKLIRRYPGGNLTTSNVAFGGPHHDQLFVTGALGPSDVARGGLFRLDLGVAGLKILPVKK